MCENKKLWARGYLQLSTYYNAFWWVGGGLVVGWWVRCFSGKDNMYLKYGVALEVPMQLPTGTGTMFEII